MYFVYILYSSSFDKYYIGQTKDLSNRLKRHNKGQSRYTKPYKPWEMVYWQEYENRSEAVVRERYLKSLKDKTMIIELVNRIPV